jgi:hypothetical protein
LKRRSDGNGSSGVNLYNWNRPLHSCEGGVNKQRKR